MINKDRGTILRFYGGHSCYEGGHRAHGRSPSPPLGKTLLEDVQYVRGYHDTCGAYHEYIRGFSVHQGDTMSISGMS